MKYRPVGIVRRKQYVDDIFDLCAHLLAIINDILNLSNARVIYFDMDDDGGPRSGVRDVGVVKN